MCWRVKPLVLPWPGGWNGMNNEAASVCRPSDCSDCTAVVIRQLAINNKMTTATVGSCSRHMADAPYRPRETTTRAFIGPSCAHRECRIDVPSLSSFQVAWPTHRVLESRAQSTHMSATMPDLQVPKHRNICTSCILPA